MYINEASKRSGATQRAIRLYEALGLLNVPRSGKYRVYNDKHIELIKIIREAQTLGIQLSDLLILKSQDEDLDWQLVSAFLIQQEEIVEDKIQTLIVQKKRIADYRETIKKCLEGD